MERDGTAASISLVDLIEVEDAAKVPALVRLSLPLNLSPCSVVVTSPRAA